MLLGAVFALNAAEIAGDLKVIGPFPTTHGISGAIAKDAVNAVLTGKKVFDPDKIAKNIDVNINIM